MGSSESILMFDGVCNLCNRLVDFIIRKDRRGNIKFVTLQSPAGRSLFRKIGLTEVDIDSVVFITGGNYFIKSSAVLHILKTIGGGWKLLYGLKIIPVCIRDYFYDIIARNRYRIFGRSDTCMLPAPDIVNRFIL